MNLYLCKRKNQAGWDEYDSFVVAALDEKEAESICEKEESDNYTVELIGHAAEGVPCGVVLGSFNAG